MRVEIPNQITVTIGGLISRGVKAVEVTDAGKLIFTLTDGSVIDLGSVMGPQGPKGETGPAGPQGQTGPAGAQGETGEAGASITSITKKSQSGTTATYTIALSDGKTFDFNVETVKSEKSDTGAKGDTGAQGPKGETGSQGPKGETGPQGEQGPKGDTGATGAEGPKGTTGDTGPKGEPGEKGEKGEKGDTGAQGPKGDPGETGPQGKTGPQGPAGPVNVPSTTSLIKGNGSGGLAAATPETDYASPIFSRKVTLTVAGWNSSTKQQTVTCAGILADITKQELHPNPVDTSYDSAWNTCGIQAVAQGANSVTFQCSEIPTTAVEVFVTVITLSYKG